MQPTGNYYDTLDSFIDKAKEATVFQLVVELTTGVTLSSSSLPIVALPGVILAIETADASKTAISVWDHKLKTLVLIPHHNVKYVSLNLG